MVFKKVVLNISGLIPIHLRIEARPNIFQKVGEIISTEKREKRARTLECCQTEWNNATKGLWTKH